MKTIRFTKGTRIYNAGELATFRDADADHYIKQGGAYECDLDGNRLSVDEATAPTLTVTSGGAATEGYSSMSKKELVDLAEKRELTVTRGEGEGEPVKADYIAALEAADEAANAEASKVADGTKGEKKPEGSAEDQGE